MTITVQKLLIEPRQTTDLDAIFQEYKTAVLKPTPTCDGALLMGVYRGKVGWSRVGYR